MCGQNNLSALQHPRVHINRQLHTTGDQNVLCHAAGAVKTVHDLQRKQTKHNYYSWCVSYFSSRIQNSVWYGSKYLYEDGYIFFNVFYNRHLVTLISSTHASCDSCKVRVPTRAEHPCAALLSRRTVKHAWVAFSRVIPLAVGQVKSCWQKRGTVWGHHLDLLTEHIKRTDTSGVATLKQRDVECILWSSSAETHRRCVVRVELPLYRVLCQQTRVKGHCVVQKLRSEINCGQHYISY